MLVGKNFGFLTHGNIAEHTGGALYKIADSAGLDHDSFRIGFFYSTVYKCVHKILLFYFELGTHFSCMRMADGSGETVGSVVGSGDFVKV